MTKKYIYQPNPDLPGDEIDADEIYDIISFLIKRDDLTLNECMEFFTELPDQSTSSSELNSATTSPLKETDFIFPGHQEAMERLVQNDISIFQNSENQNENWLNQRAVTNESKVKRQKLFKEASEQETPPSVAQVDSIFFNNHR